MEYLDRLTITPYRVELNNAIGTALWRASNLLRHCASVCALDKREHSGAIALSDWGPQRSEANREIFDELEAFLAVWARVSLLLFPSVPKGDKLSRRQLFRARRGLTLRYLHAVTDGGPLSDRDYRDSWVHTDERMDAAILQGQHLGNQLFIRSGALHANTTRMHLRVIVVDTHEIYIRGRDQEPHRQSIAEMRQALLELENDPLGREQRLATLPATAA